MLSSAALDCMPSPDGRFVATLRHSELVVRSTETLEVTNAVRLPSGSGSGSPPASSAASSSTSLSPLLWAPSSSKVLICSADQLDVFGATHHPEFHATVRNYTSLTGGKPSLIQFGARDTELLIWSASGLKLVVVDVCGPGVVEIASPKFHQATSAARGLAVRPETGHLALLSRSGGRDILSLHNPVDRQVLRSWYPDTLDAQGISWTPDGKWLLLWESAVQGHRLLIHTPDGQHFRTITASNLLKGPDAELELGIRICQLSPNAEMCAIGDHSRDVCILQTHSWRARMRLSHPATIVPKDTLQVWQEKIEMESLQARASHTFLKASQILSPPGSATDVQSAAETKAGCSMAAFDASSTLLATRLDDSPCTLWIWDIVAAELRAVLIFHSTVSFQWHASSRELLLITSQDPAQHGVSFIWDPLSDGPTPLVPEDHLPTGRAVGKAQVAWINRETESPVLFVSDAEHYLLLSPSNNAGRGANPWQAAVDSSGSEMALDSPTSARFALDEGDGASVVDDTFSFRNA
ncbi:WD repeat-containing protein WRAP73 [Trichoderma ghanense]|uniref:WD repeat-containing protein WRAP73 n=1 Tax=Trichoderma ghanense TaxID=65468 RepID=A0ABY2HCL1_9HYPO